MNQHKGEQAMPAITLRAAETSSAPLETEADLAALADQLLTIAQELRRNDPTHSAVNVGPAQAKQVSFDSMAFLQSTGTKHDPLELARSTYANRRSRTAIFGNEELFGEPAWDILLDLYIAHLEGKPVSVSSACIGSASPPTTGLRWLGVLADSGLIIREHDAEDQRRVLVRLTNTGLVAMEEYFAREAVSRALAR